MAEISNWPGLFTDTSPHQNPGSRVQENCHARSVGTLAARKGRREVFFGNATARGSVATLTDLDDVLAMAAFTRPDGDVVVWLEDDGTVRYGKKLA